MFNKVCEFCKKPFEGKKSKIRFCSKSCSGSFTGALKDFEIEKKCEVCDSLFIAKGHRAKFCSKKCYEIKKCQFYLHNCKKCNKEFRTKEKSSVYCSRECFKASLPSGYNLICLTCNKSFNTDCKKRKYCSQACRELKPKIFHEHICEFCKKIFKDQNIVKKYCSQNCAHEESKTGEIVACFNCGKSCYQTAYAREKFKKSFCSFECNMDFQRKRRPTRICKNCGIEFRKIAKKYCSTYCARHSEENILNLAKMCRSQSVRKENKLEKAGYELLAELGFKFERQFNYGKRYVADAYLKDYNLIMLFDGDYWHGNPIIFKKLSDRQLRQKNVDSRANEAAIKYKFNILRLWENEIHKQPVLIKEKIINFIKGLNFA